MTARPIATHIAAGFARRTPSWRLTLSITHRVLAGMVVIGLTARRRRIPQ